MADAELNVDDLLTETPVEATPEVVEPEPKTAEPIRDEAGKFAVKPETTEAPKVEGEKPATERTADDAANVPSWRLREVADEKRASDARANALEQQLAQVNARLALLDKPKEQPKQEDIDPLIDPQGFAKRMTDGFESRMREERLNYNLGLAHVRHGDKFEKAYNALLQAAQSGNRQIVPQLTGQANPGEAIVKWYTEQETLREVGGDPAAYKTKLLEDALKDPTYLAKAIEAAKASAGQSRPNNITQLPPSLSRATGSSASADSDSEVMGVEALLAR